MKSNTIFPRLVGILILASLLLAACTSPAATSDVSYTHLRAHENPEHLVCRLLLEKKNKKQKQKKGVLTT